MLELELLKNFLVALALGALIGLEREYTQSRGKYHSFAGIRTFPLIALFGALITYLSQLSSFWFLLAGTLILSGLILAAYYTSSIRSRYHGITTAMAALISFLVGILVMYNYIILALVLAIFTATLLYAKTFLHHFAKKIEKKELSSTLKFAIIAFVILPFLPNQSYGPYQLFNPFIIWLMVVFISGISFAGYILIKWFGEKGIEMTGIFGGLISSTAVTTSFAERSKKQIKLYPSLILAVILANGVMFIRILIEVFVLNQSLFLKMLFPLTLLAFISLIFAYFLWRKAKEIKQSKLELSSPFTLGPALKFGAFFALILALVKLADVYLSSQGVYLVSLISGFAGIDAITVSLSQLAKENLAENIAQKGILLATLSNILVKGGIAFFFGSRQFGRIILAFFTILILTGLGIIFLL